MSGPIALQLVPGYQFPTDGSQVLTYDLLNKLATPTVNLIGAIGTLSLSDGSVTTTKLADGALAASSTGRGKMAAGFFGTDSISRGLFTAGFFGTDATSQAMFADGFFATVSPLIGATRNLFIQNQAASPSSKITITADELLVKDTNNAPYLAQAASLTVDITASGANGLDTGAEASSTWYYVWAIWNGTTLSGLLSVSGTSPTMPGGYSFKALIGTVYNDGSSNFRKFIQMDRRAWTQEVNVFTATGPGSTGAFQIQSISTMVPPIAKRVQGLFGVSSQTTQAMMVAGMAVDGSTPVGTQITGTPSGVPVLDLFNGSASFDVPINSGLQRIYWGGTTTGSVFRMSVTGYDI